MAALGCAASQWPGPGRVLERMHERRSVVTKQGSYQPIFKQFDLYALREMRIQDTLFTTFILLFTTVKKRFIFNSTVYVTRGAKLTYCCFFFVRMQCTHACVHV
jgi:hypothetical protein